jgi:hypothetical protein
MQRMHSRVFGLEIVAVGSLALVFACAGRQSLTTAELQQEYLGKREWKCWGKMTGTAEHFTDGHFTVFFSDGLEENGEFSFKNNMYCEKGLVGFAGREICSVVYRVGPNQYRQEAINPDFPAKCDVTLER